MEENISNEKPEMVNESIISSVVEVNQDNKQEDMNLGNEKDVPLQEIAHEIIIENTTSEIIEIETLVEVSSNEILPVESINNELPTIEKETEVSSILKKEKEEIAVNEASTIETEVIAENIPEVENIANPIEDSVEIHEELSQELEIIEEKVDYAKFNSTELIKILETSVELIKEEGAGNVEFKKADNQLKEIKPIFDTIKNESKKVALEQFKAENGSDEGFEYKESDEIVLFDTLYKKIKEAKYQHFNAIEKNKENNFTKKTELLNQLRHLADTEDGNISTVKENINELRKLQQSWKEAGNIASPHNNTLWQTYHALVDRFYSNRGIYFELLELDRKKNLNQKVELCSKAENIAQRVQETELTNKDFQEITHIFEEFKHIGPATKEANELLWQRFKAALDVIYNKKREQIELLKGSFEENLAAKQNIIESLSLFTSFKSESINEWMEQTKAIDILQKQWDEIKGPLPKDKTRDINKNFWNGVKQFYRNKSDFFKALETKREENLKQKEILCEQVETFLASEDDSAENTKAVIRLQEEWRKIGHVPEKFRNKIYERFKLACDGYFNKKRQKNNETEKSYNENLAQKIALCEKIEKLSKESTGVEILPTLKAEWAAIGFVPKAEIANLQKRYISAINGFVGAIGKLSDKEKEKLTLETEVEFIKQNDKNSSKDLGRKEGDIRNKIQNLENDLSTLKNNLEFFGRSKNADKIKADFEQKIKKGEADLAHMKHQLKVVRQAAD